MTDPWDLVLMLLLLAAIVEMIAAIYAAVRMRMKYGRSFIESLLWDRLVMAEQRTVIAAVIGLVVACWAVFATAGLVAPLPRPWGAIATLGAFMLLLWGPIDDLLVANKLTRRVELEGDDDDDVRCPGGPLSKEK